MKKSVWDEDTNAIKASIEYYNNRENIFKDAKNENNIFDLEI